MKNMLIIFKYFEKNVLELYLYHLLQQKNKKIYN